ncbi:Sec8 exocyst complex component-specific domain-containing protein [Trametopsis cervina]|nr:Sec8 exocyst complex component-specific domain-containing protein [Trametopsis cervina]
MSDRTSVDSRYGEIKDSRDSGGQRPSRNDVSGPSRPSNEQVDTNSLLSPLSPSGESEISPSGAAAIAAFQHAFARRRDKAGDEYADTEYERERQREIAIQMDRQKRIREKVPGRRPTKPRAGDIDAVLDEIKDEWEVVTNPDFNPVDLALQLLDDSSGGRDMRSFRQTKDMLSKALKGSVDKHYEAFAASLPHHSSLLARLQAVQTQISEARTALQESKENLGGKRGDLVQLRTRTQTLEEMLRILDQIEHLRAVPDVLESLISEKRLLQAAVLLVRSLKLINKQDMLEIGALADLRSYLTSQDTAIRDILVDELHSHLYLRSFWCESRWAAYVPNQQACESHDEFTQLEFEEEAAKDQAPSSPVSPSGLYSKAKRLARYLDDLNVRPNEAPLEADEQSYRNSASLSLQGSTSMSFGIASLPSRSSLLAGSTSVTGPTMSSRNPEADSFTYMETLLESLAVLGKLGHALDTLSQKLPQEIYSLVETTLDEVSERAEYGRRTSVFGSSTSSNLGRDNVYFLAGSGASEPFNSSNIIGSSMAANSSITDHSNFLPAALLRLAALEMSTKRTDQEIMKDLFWTLYSKLDAVAQGLRVVYEVSNRIGSRRDFKDSSGTKPGALFPLAEIWDPVQAEIRTLLNDYITDGEQGVVSGRNPISSINEVLRSGRYFRDKSKPVFRFADTDLKLSTKVLKVHEDELTRVLKDTVPGLVQGSSESAVQATLSAVGSDDRLLGPGQHHRLLVHPDAFHVSVLFQPTISFMDRISDILPSGHETSRDSNMLLDEFVLNVYLPQLEDKVSDIFHHAVTSPDAFQPDSTSKRLSSQPLIKVVVQLLALINSLCVMLRTTPFHRESYSRLILTVIVQFYQRCSDRFQDLVTLKNADDPESVPRIALAAQWAQRSEVIACMSELYAVISDESQSRATHQLCRQESHLEGQLLGDRTVTKDELVSSTRNLAGLASLYHSVTWFAVELDKLKSAPEGVLSPTTPHKLEPMSATTPWTPYMPVTQFNAQEPLTLPLSTAMAMRFQALQKTYEQLSESILHTIRIDIRCRVMHHLDLALKHGNYNIDVVASEPDPHVVDLNAELATCDDYASVTLPPKERRFVFEGLSHLMQSLLVSKAKYIRATNANGIKKMLRNILALQQNIKTIALENRHVEFERAKMYYALFALTLPQLLDTIRKKQEFTFDEYKTILDLQCGVDPTLGEKGANQASDRNYSMYVIELHGLELENSGADDVE